jgi:hypothetical protein
LNTRPRLLLLIAGFGAALALPLGAAASGTSELILPVAGNGNGGYSGDGGPAPEANLQGPRGVATGANGAYLIADTKNHRIRQVGGDGSITTVAGTGTSGFNGDGLLGPLTHLDEPAGVARTSDGSYLIVDTRDHRRAHG